jgi:hypothetical protein
MFNPKGYYSLLPAPAHPSIIGISWKGTPVPLIAGALQRVQRSNKTGDFQVGSTLVSGYT